MTPGKVSLLLPGGESVGFGIDLNLRLGPLPEIGGGGGGSSGNDDEDEEEEDEEGEGPTAQSVVVADVVAEPVESGEESTVEKGSGRAPRVLEESSAISPAVRSSEDECDSEEESRKEAAEGTKESSGITTAPSKKTDDGDEDEEAADAEEEEERPSKRRAAEVAQGSSKRRGAGWLPFDLYVDSAPLSDRSTGGTRRCRCVTGTPSSTREQGAKEVMEGEREREELEAREGAALS